MGRNRRARLSPGRARIPSADETLAKKVGPVGFEPTANGL